MGKSRKFKIMLKASKPLSLVNINHAKHFRSLWPIPSDHGFFPRGIQSSKIWPQSCQSVCTLWRAIYLWGSPNQNHLFSRMAPREQKLSAYLYWLYGGVKTPPPFLQNISNFKQINRTAKSLGNSDFSRNQWKNAIFFPPDRFPFLVNSPICKAYNRSRVKCTNLSPYFGVCSGLDDLA